MNMLNSALRQQVIPSPARPAFVPRSVVLRTSFPRVVPIKLGAGAPALPTQGTDSRGSGVADIHVQLPGGLSSTGVGFGLLRLESPCPTVY